MKKIAFVTVRKLLAQGLSAAMEARPELDLTLLPMLSPAQALLGVEVHGADVAVLDVTDGARGLCALCMALRERVPSCRILLLVSQEEPSCREAAVQARQKGFADDFVFYDSSMCYLLAKLSAF